ncbi:MAG TPA: fused MFS/spermidine synthase [Pyrinomonadaceae bacterium]|nr:fused MFS/spermidine synthase [Pyrinomonadaceae bacterium]
MNPSNSRSTTFLIGACFVLSGATGLIYEVLWARMLGLVFGATTLAVSTVLAAFMGGLALGSALAGRLAPRIKKPVAVYGWMEIAIAVYALLVPLLFSGIDNLYASIWQQLQPGFFAFTLLRFALSCLLLLVPTTLMGATLPVLSAALLRSADHVPNSVTRLYACNLAGAILGTLVAGFVLLPEFGVRRTIFIAAGINIVVGLVALTIQRRITVKEDQVRRGPVVMMGQLQGEIDGTRFWLFAAFASGFVTISTQVSWTRVLTMIIGSSTYAFSIVVALFLIGLALGAWITSRTDRAANLRTRIIVVELITAASLVLSMFVLNRIPGLLISAGLTLEINAWPGLLALQIMAATLLILVPALLMGMVMPLVLVWAGNQINPVNRVGRSYAINTIGAIVGAFVTGFVLIPMTSTRFTLLLATAFCIVVAGLAYQPAQTGWDPALKRSLAIGVTLVLVLLPFVVAPRMNLADLSIGAYDSLVRVLANTREGVPDSQANSGNVHELLMYREGPTATVSVRRDGDTVSMAINGRTNASDSIYDMPTQVMLGQLPMLIAPRPNNALVIGFATGITVGAMLQSPVQSVTCVELEPRTIEGSEFFNHVNNRPLDDPRTTLIIDDARTYLRVTPNRYDAIVSEPSHPWVPGVANLFTREFFELGHARLSEQGIFVQWVQIYQLSIESLRSVLATYQSVFPHVLVFRVGGSSRGKDLLLVGSNQPVGLDRLAERMGDARVSGELARVNLRSEADVRSWFVCDETRLGPAVSGARINTDDNMHIETTVPREAFRPLMQTNVEWVEALAMPRH